VQSAPPSLAGLLLRDAAFLETAKATLAELSKRAPGPIEAFLRKGGHFPIAVVSASIDVYPNVNERVSQRVSQ